MYPAEYLNLFPPFPQNDIVFVAMSFDSKFTPRWENVIIPAVSNLDWKGNKLKPHRVDLTKKSDSIITEIVQNIAQCRLILADISTISYLNGFFQKKKPIRNPNVLYEVGIAHASRLPEEVLLLRSDKDPLDFDISGVRVHEYDPSNEAEAIIFVSSLIEEALKSIDNRKNIAVQKAIQSLNLNMYMLLQESMKFVLHPTLKTMGDMVSNIERIADINRLLNSGMIEIDFKKLTPELLNKPIEHIASYKITPFGRAVLSAVREKTDLTNAMNRWSKTPEGQV